MQTWSINSDLHAYKNVPPHAEAVVLLVHGFGERAEGHASTIQALARRNIAVYSYNPRGHGRSPGARRYVERFADLVDDSIVLRERVAALHPDLPFILMGAGMGGVVAVRSAQREPHGLDGVVLVAPALPARPGGPLVRGLAALIGRIAPAAPVAKVKLAALSRDVEIIAAASAALDELPQWRLPALIVHGDTERIAGPDGTRRFAAAAPTANVTLRLVPGADREPLNEPGSDVLADEVATWILARQSRDATPAAGANHEAGAGAGNGAHPDGGAGEMSGVVADQRTGADRGAGADKGAGADNGFGADNGSGAGAESGLPTRRVYTWWEGLAFGAVVNVVARLLGTNTGRYEAIDRPWFAPPGWVFPVAWSINSTLAIWGNLRVLNAKPSTDRTAYLRLWAATWLLYLSFGYAFFRRKSPLLGFLVTTNFLALSVLSAGRAVRIERRLWIGYATLLPWLLLAAAVAGSVALTNPDPLLDSGADAPER